MSHIAIAIIVYIGIYGNSSKHQPDMFDETDAYFRYERRKLGTYHIICNFHMCAICLIIDLPLLKIRSLSFFEIPTKNTVINVNIIAMRILSICASE